MRRVAQVGAGGPGCWRCSAPSHWSTPPPAGADAPNLASGYGITVGGLALDHRPHPRGRHHHGQGGGQRGERPAPRPHHAAERLLPVRHHPLPRALPAARRRRRQHARSGRPAAASSRHITDGKPLITVMPDGGKVGWYTNWVSQSGGAQAWRDFHVDQLIPWIDANLRTIASKSGRAIAGLSMGGFGAVRYAQDRPDLFAFVGQLLGRRRPRRLRHPLGRRPSRRSRTATRATPSSATRSGRSTAPGTRSTRSTGPPASRACRSRSTPAAAATTRTCSRARCGHRPTGSTTRSNAAGVPHFYWMYGRPGASAATAATTSAAGTSPSTTRCPACSPCSRRPADPRRLRLRRPPTRSSTVGSRRRPGSVGLHRQLRRRPRRRPGPHRHRQRLGPQHHRLERPAPDDRRVAQPHATRSRRGCGPRPTTPTGTSGCARRPGRSSASSASGASTATRKLTVNVSTGANTSLVLFAGLWANGDTWFQIDDVTAVRL